LDDRLTQVYKSKEKFKRKQDKNNKKKDLDKGENWSLAKFSEVCR